MEKSQAVDGMTAFSSVHHYFLQTGMIKDEARRSQAWGLMKLYGDKGDAGHFPAFFEKETIRTAMSETYDVDDLLQVARDESDSVPTRFDVWFPEFSTQVSPIIKSMLISNDDPKATLDKLAKAAQTAKSNS